MYRTIIRRDGNNPLTGRAQYRVVASCINSPIFGEAANEKVWQPINGKLGLMTSKTYQPNCFINPRKALGI